MGAGNVDTLFILLHNNAQKCAPFHYGNGKLHGSYHLGGIHRNCGSPHQKPDILGDIFRNLPDTHGDSARNEAVSYHRGDTVRPAYLVTVSLQNDSKGIHTDSANARKKHFPIV